MQTADLPHHAHMVAHRRSYLEPTLACSLLCSLPTPLRLPVPGCPCEPPNLNLKWYSALPPPPFIPAAHTCSAPCPGHSASYRRMAPPHCMAKGNGGKNEVAGVERRGRTDGDEERGRGG